MLQQVGFTNIHTERLMTKFEFPSADAYAQWCAETQAPVPAMLANQPTEKQAEVPQAMTRFAQQYAGTDGVVYMPFESVLMIGQKS
jgi:hypothetical protein